MSIESIRARLEAATPGPWRAMHDHEIPDAPHSLGEVWGSLSESDYLLAHDGDPAPSGRADADFIVHAITDVELLLAVAEAARRLYAASLDYETTMLDPAASGADERREVLTCVQKLKAIYDANLPLGVALDALEAAP